MTSQDSKSLLYLAGQSNLSLLCVLFWREYKRSKKAVQEIPKYLPTHLSVPERDSPRTRTPDRSPKHSNPAKTLSNIGLGGAIRSFENDYDINKKVNDGSIPSPIYKVCITGGPCAGKSTAMATLEKKFTEYGYRIFIVPEVATQSMLGGGNIVVGLMPWKQAIIRQNHILEMQRHLEDYFVKMAEIVTLKPCMIFCDRGLVDGKAYVTDDLWQAIMSRMKTTKFNQVQRYFAVVHMVTAADGAIHAYTLENNAARSEGLEQARELDVNLQNCYTGHANHIIIKNKPGRSFEHKIRRCLEEVKRVVGLDSDSGLELKPAKYLLFENIKKWPGEVKCEILHLEVIFLKLAKTEKGNTQARRITKTTRGPVVNYHMKSQEYEDKKPDPNSADLKCKHKHKRTKSEMCDHSDMSDDNEDAGSSRGDMRLLIEKSKKLNSAGYLTQKHERDTEVNILYIRRKCFIYSKTTYSINEYLISKPIYILEKYRTKDDQCKAIDHLPEWVQHNIDKPINNDEMYTQWGIVKTFTENQKTSRAMRLYGYSQER